MDPCRHIYRWFKFGLILNLLLVGFTRAVPMTLWDLDPDNENSLWRIPGTQTWHAELPLQQVLPDADPDDKISYPEIVAVAKSLWDWLQRVHGNGWENGNKARLVSVMYNHGTTTFYASTIPVGMQKAEMLSSAATGDARFWYAQVRSMITFQNGFYRGQIHAEDGVFYNFEMSKGVEPDTLDPPEDIVKDGKYAGDPWIVTYGMVRDMTEPKVIPLCGAYSSRDIPCKIVAPALGVSEITTRNDPSLAPQNTDAQDNDGRQTSANRQEAINGPAAKVDAVQLVNTTNLANITNQISQLLNNTNNVEDEQNDETTQEEWKAINSMHSACSAGVKAAACSNLLYPPRSTPSGRYSVAPYLDSSGLTLIKPTQSLRFPNSTRVSAKPTITSAPTTLSTATSKKLSCIMQNESPDQGINTRYCICGSATLPLMSIPTTAQATAACDYTTIPSSTTLSVTTGFHSTMTNNALCQVCTQVAEYGNTCTTIPGCLPQKATASVKIATSAVHVGTLTGSALYTSVSNALESICPPVTQTTSATECKGTAKIKGIAYVDDSTLAKDGELDVSIPWSSYNETSLRDAMIKSLASSAMSSANGSNCYQATYLSRGLKRDLLQVEGPGQNASLAAQDGTLTSREDTHPQEERITLCNTAELAQVEYFSPFWRTGNPGATDYIEAQYSFHLPPGGNFLCEFMEFLIEDLAIIEPEFTVADIELGSAIEALCTELEGH